MSRFGSRFGVFATTLGLALAAGCTDIQDDAVERGIESPPGEIPAETAPVDTLHQPVPPAPGVEEPSAGEPRTPAQPLETEPTPPPATPPPDGATGTDGSGGGTA